jgi:hypothetical protein
VGRASHQFSILNSPEPVHTAVIARPHVGRILSSSLQEGVMATVIDVTETAQEMIRLWQEVKESGLLEELRDTVSAADGYLRQADRAARQMQPPAEHARPAPGEVDAAGKDVGRLLREHHTLMQSAATHAQELRAYVIELEHLWGRLAA